ncbi:hypothetical protein AK812_SmicGene34705 [Symbiodinium microadriaticum]|uniref:Uncharacterized protein n=1 Tax=Symbiodinium microadriaticum TaxID=2951 RepID=A0A1Q9CNE8_SYMMI|nr:hypothetical protein AK812_SmicGene34705 [Symbiodinium microadriaticum]
MDAMSSAPRQSEQLLVGFGLVVLTFHFRYNYSGLRCWLAQAAQGKQESALSESESLRVEEKLHEVRCKMFINWAHERFSLRHFTLLVAVLVDTFMMLDDISNRISTLQYAHMNLAQRSSETFTPVCLLQQSFQAAAGIGLPFIVDAVLRDWIAVSFRSKVSVDVCHVPLPNLYGTKTVHYLLSLTEDLDPRVPPMQLQEDSQQSRFKDQEGEVRSAQSAASSETHVEGGALALPAKAEFRLGMPTLKRFARPLDWENLNGYLRHYARQVGKGLASEKQSLGSIMLRMPGEARKLLQARHLANFKDKRPRNSRPRLAGLDEDAKVYDEPGSAAINSTSSFAAE